MSGNNDYKNKTLNQNFVAKNSEFAFKCHQCGDCCRNIAPQDKILLSTVDIFRASKALDMEPTDFIGQYCEMVPGKESMLPLIILKERLDGSCIFLKKGICSIYEDKPIACSMHPLGRMFFLNEETNQQDFHYYLKPFMCKATKDEIQTVQSWLDRFKIEEFDKCIKVYKRLGRLCSKMMHSASSDDERREMFVMVFGLMYLQYDIKKDLLEQLKNNLDIIENEHGESSSGMS